MKTHLLGAVFAASLIAGVAGAQAQVAAPGTTTTTTTRTTITPAQQTQIKQYVVKEKRTSVSAPSGFTLSVGSTLPESVQVYALPSDVGVTSYRYTVVNDRTVLIDPSDRRVVEVLD